MEVRNGFPFRRPATAETMINVRHCRVSPRAFDAQVGAGSLQVSIGQEGINHGDKVVREKRLQGTHAALLLCQATVAKVMCQIHMSTVRVLPD